MASFTQFFSKFFFIYTQHFYYDDDNDQLNFTYNNFLWPEMIPNFELKIKTNFFRFFEKSSLQQKMNLYRLNGF
jgi:hypothetical protein